MRTKFLFMLCSFMMLFFTLSSFKTEMPLNKVELNIQDSKEVVAVYDGNNESGYSFTAQSDDEQINLLFQKVDDAVLSEFDLNSQALVGTSFKVQYSTEVLIISDVETEVNTIAKLEKL